MASHLYGMHDYSSEWASLVKQAGVTAWCVQTIEIKDYPGNIEGFDFEAQSRGMPITWIVRLNYSHHGEGTIPLDRAAYGRFAETCATYVAKSRGCTKWIIGNEPNITVEGAIPPEDYIECYRLCYEAIKRVGVQHEVMIAPVAPWNVDSQPWMTYWANMLSLLGRRGLKTDGFPIHTYSRGASKESIWSEDKMNPPYHAYYNGFRTYRDWLTLIPSAWRHLPVYITETDQNEEWLDRNTGWVDAACQEISAWNRVPGNQPIRCLVLYRWYIDDKWNISRKRGVIDMFIQALEKKYIISGLGKETIHMPQIEHNGPYLKVTAPAGAQVRRGPGTAYPSLGAVAKELTFKIIGRDVDFKWWKVETPLGAGWISGSIAQVFDIDKVPVVMPDGPPPASTTPTSTPQSNVVGQPWMISAWSRVLGIEETVVRAIMAIESGGRGFDGNRMIIRFENHVFYDQLTKLAPHLVPDFNRHFSFGRPLHTNHKWRKSENDAWEPQHEKYDQDEEWEVLELAKSIHTMAALRSISMGMAQIMGFNHAKVGYATVDGMFNDYNNRTLGDANQLVGFFAFIYNSGLVQPIRDHNWRAIAGTYNGLGGVENYAPLIRQKYLELGGKD